MPENRAENQLPMLKHGHKHSGCHCDGNCDYCRCGNHKPQDKATT